MKKKLLLLLTILLGSGLGVCLAQTTQSLYSNLDAWGPYVALQSQYKYYNRAMFTKQVLGCMGTWNSFGTGGVPFVVNGDIYQSLAPLNSVTTGNTLATINIPPNSLNTTGDSIRFRIYGKTAANGNTKTLLFKWGSTSITLYNSTGSGTDIYVDIVVYRTAASAQNISVVGWAGGALLNGLSTTSTQTETSNIAAVVQLSTATANNDLTINRIEADANP